MVNELCELAASGVNSRQIAIFGIVTLILSVALFTFRKKLGLKTKWLMPVAFAIFTFTTPLQPLALAQSAENCSPQQGGSQAPNPGAPEALGGLIDDSPEIAYDEEYGAYYATFSVLPNDNAPNGDSFDISTLQLLGDYPHPEYPNAFLILDPDNPVPPETPNPENPDWANVWGVWSLELTCDPDDAEHCGTDPDDSVYCYDPSGGTCWPTGEVSVWFYSSIAQPGTYSIQYTVNTHSGASLEPATITVTIPAPSPIITASNGITFSNNGTCGPGPWDSGWSLNIMDLVETSGSSPLLASTIDLDPGTPGIQSTVSYGTSYATTVYTVVNGIVTVETPNDPDDDDAPHYGFSYTIQDADGNISNEAVGVSIEPNNGCD